MYIAIFITAAHKKQARRIAQGLLKKKLVACVNIIEKAESWFWWQGKIAVAKEALLVVKSKKEKLNRIIKTVESLHNYDVPEIIALAIIAGEEKYLRWIDATLR